MNNMVYMDYNATTPVDEQVIKGVNQGMTELWQNPSSSYPSGLKAKEAVNLARKRVAAMLNASDDHEILFTSGATEANNILLYSLIQQCDVKPHVIISTIEHPSVDLIVKKLVDEKKLTASYIPIDFTTGKIDISHIQSILQPNTKLISVMLANNETGVIQPIKELVSFVHKENLSVLVHTDAAQAVGKVVVDVNDLGVDFLTLAGHKFYATKGIGALYCRKVSQIKPLFFGGGQEFGLRPGTESTPYIIGLGIAADLVKKNIIDYYNHLKEMRDFLEFSLKETFGSENVLTHFSTADCFSSPDRLPNTCNMSLRLAVDHNVSGRIILQNCQFLEASVGAACHNSDSANNQSILLKCGISSKVANSAIRLSVGRSTTRNDVEVAVNDLRKALHNFI